MTKLMTAVALAVALPGVAHAQAAPAGKPKMECCEKMKDKCDKMAGKSASAAPSSANPHAGHDMKPAPPAGGNTRN